MLTTCRPISKAARSISCTLGALPSDGGDPLELQGDGSKIVRQPVVLDFKAAQAPVELFVLAEDPLDLLEFAEGLVHKLPLEQSRRRAELGQRRTDDVAGFVAELVRPAKGATVRNQGFARPTQPPIPA